MTMFKVVGIDPGLAGTGVGVVQGVPGKIAAYSFGSISTSPRDGDVPFRLKQIFTQARDFLKEQAPDLVVIEDIYSLEKYPGSGIMLGKVSGVLLLAAHDTGTVIHEVAVREAKKIISGNGRADKHQMERAVRNILGHPEPISPFHASDALGLALTGLYRYAAK